MRQARFLLEDPSNKALSSARSIRWTTSSASSSSSIRGGGFPSNILSSRSKRSFPLLHSCLHKCYYSTSSILCCYNKTKSNVCVDDVISERAIRAFNRQNNEEKIMVVIGKDDDKGWALYAKQDIQTGQTVFGARALQTYFDDKDDETASTSSTCNTSTARGSHTIQTGWKTHVIMDLPAILVNHSCRANIGILGENSRGAYDFVALRDIAQGEEMLWDYETSEYDMYSSSTTNTDGNSSDGFQCSCGASNCRGTLKGYRDHGPAVVELYGKDHIAPYLLRGGGEE